MWWLVYPRASAPGLNGGRRHGYSSTAFTYILETSSTVCSGETLILKQYFSANLCHSWTQEERGSLATSIRINLPTSSWFKILRLQSGRSFSQSRLDPPITPTRRLRSR